MPARSTKTTSIGKRIQNVWTLPLGSMISPVPNASSERPINPLKRLQNERATSAPSANVVPRDSFAIFMTGGVATIPSRCDAQLYERCQRDQDIASVIDSARREYPPLIPRPALHTVRS